VHQNIKRQVNFKMVKYARITKRLKVGLKKFIILRFSFSFLENANSNEMDPSKTPDIKRINSNDLW